jgi:alpha/beta superfamily hydrolase
MAQFEAGLDGVAFTSNNCRLLGGLYRAGGTTHRPTAVLLHGLPGIEKHLDIAYTLRDLGWNCLYFHFRGCWGSQGDYSLAGLVDDTCAVVEWVRNHPAVDPGRIVLIGTSTGSHPALLHAATDFSIRAMVGVSPVIEPSAFGFPPAMADAFADMLNGVTGPELMSQWDGLPPLTDAIRALAPRPFLIVAAEKDDIFPPSQYVEALAPLSHVELIRHPDADHGFSSCRPWLVRTVTDWLVSRLGN